LHVGADHPLRLGAGLVDPQEAGLRPVAEQGAVRIRQRRAVLEMEDDPLGSRAMEIGRAGVVGLGTMGAGIAQLCVQAGVDTVGHEMTSELGERGRATIERYLTRGVEKGRMTPEEGDAALGRLSLTTEPADLAACDLVIEAVIEDLPAKREVFAELDRLLGPEAVLATNTSALSVTEIAAATSRPQRVVGMHFFNPAPVMPLVEVVRTELTDDAAFETAYAFAERLGKQPIACNDTPGFVVNRILIPLLNDCVRVIDEARVSPEDVDRAMRFGTNWPIGPCALLDLIGIDVHVHASEALYDALREPRMAPPPRLVRMAQAGNLGRKSGRGFFQYED
jgi:3-hydroxybutyryl-CoA dehydrogenase